MNNQVGSSENIDPPSPGGAKFEPWASGADYAPARNVGGDWETHGVVASHRGVSAAQGTAGTITARGDESPATNPPRPANSAQLSPEAENVVESQSVESFGTAEVDETIAVRRREEFAKVSASVAAKGAVRVIVEFAVPNYAPLAAASESARGAQAVGAADGQLAAAIGAVWQVELGKMAGTQYTVNRTYNSIPFVALSVSPGALAALERSAGIRGINEDWLAKPLLNNTVNIIGASAAWNRGLDGSGWYVAILDTGIRDTHNFFAGKDIVQACFSLGQDAISGVGDCPTGFSTDTTSPNAARHFPTDPTSDHGTHVVGIATGRDWPLFGVAPGANIIDVQVFSQFHSDGNSSAMCNG